VARHAGGRRWRSRATTSPPEFVDAFVRGRCASLTKNWLVDFVSRRNTPLPELVNRDGEALLFGEVRFRVEEEHRTEIEAALHGADDWVREPMDGSTWIWIDTAPAATPSRSGLSIRSETEDGKPILGTAELHDDALVFTANSRVRTEQGTSVLESLLGDRRRVVGKGRDLVSPPRSAHEKLARHGPIAGVERQ